MKQVPPQVFSRPPRRFAGQRRLTGSGRRTGIGRRSRIGHMPFNGFNGKAGCLGYDLYQDRADALADAGGR